MLIVYVYNVLKSAPKPELNPGLPRDRRKYLPLYYLGYYFYNSFSYVIHYSIYSQLFISGLSSLN